MALNPEDLICPQCSGPKSKQARGCAKCTGEGHTSEQRDHLSTPLCGARKKNGEKCRAFAGQGTDHLGVAGTPCKYHGGSTSGHRQHAVALEARRRMVTMGTPIENITAPEALMGLLRSSAGAVSWLQQEVAALDSLAGHEAAVIVQLYDSERKMLLQVSEACIRAGVAEHVVRMEQQRAATAAAAVKEAARDAGLNPKQVQALGVSLRRRFAEVSGEAIDTDATDARLKELREAIKAEEERRIARAAERRARDLSGLTFPPDELVPAPDDAA